MSVVATPFVTVGTLGLYGTDEFGVSWSVNLQEFRGWDRTDSTITLEPRTRAHGSWAGDAFDGPRHVSIGGLIKAPDEAAMWAARDRLDAACTLGETVLTVHESGRDRWVRARREGGVLVTLASPTVARYSVQFVCPDPRRFGTELVGEVRLPSTSGGLRWPVRFPVRFPAVTSGGAVSLVNPGLVSGPVWLRLDGPTNPADPPLQAPVVTHVSTGRRLVFASSLSLGHGEFVVVDAEAQTVLAQGTASRAGWVTEDGFPSFEPGVNTFALSASVYSASASCTVRALPAW